MDPPADEGVGRGPGGPPHKLAALLSTWFGCGYSPIAPGTAGSLAALLIGIALHAYAGFAWWHFLLLAAIGFWPAVWAAGVTARAAGIEDPQFPFCSERCRIIDLGNWATGKYVIPSPIPKDEEEL